MRKYSIYEYFYFTRAERNASVILSFICMFFFIPPFFSPYMRPPQPDPDFEEFKKTIAPLIAQMEAEKGEESENAVVFRGGKKDAPAAELFHFDPNTATKDELVRLGLSPRTAQTVLNYRAKGGQFRKAEDFKKLYTLRPEDYERLSPWISIENKKGEKKQTGFLPGKTKAEPFHFDPNTAGKEDFTRLGLSGKTAQSILNYRSKGGHFYKKEDFGKIYTLDTADYKRLEPWIEIVETERKEKKFAGSGSHFPKFEKKDWAPQPIDINVAKAEDWEQFRGIGPGFAKRIVNFRENLGGFVSVAQVAETYKLPDSTFQNMREYLQMPTGVFRPLKVNSAGMEELKSHPYLNSFQATIIFNYRKQHGKFTDLDNMKKIKAGFKPADWERLGPYLSFE